MARRRYGRRYRRHARKLPLITLGILVGQAAVAWGSTGDALNAVDQFQSYYTGFVMQQKKFVPQNLLLGWGPHAVNGLLHKFGRPMGILPRVPAGLPVSLS